MTLLRLLRTPLRRLDVRARDVGPPGPADFTAAAFSAHHFPDLQVLGDRLHLHAIDHGGRIFDSLALPALAPVHEARS